MSLMKMNKHEVYKHIADNLDWFKGSSPRYLSCQAIGKMINQALAKDCVSDPPQIKLSGATLTAMVYDGVMEREFVESARCYWYRPILPINEEYKND